LTWIKAPVAAAVGFTANDALQSAAPETRRKASALFATDAKAANVDDSRHSPVTYIERRSVPIGADESSSLTAKSSALESLAAGGVAGAVAKTVIAPADRVKIIFQVDPNRPFSVRDAFGVAKDIVRREGFVGLWRGNGVMMARVVPYAGVSFMTYPRFEAAARRAKKQARDAWNAGPASAKKETDETVNENASDVTTRFVAGSAAGATATAMTYPLDLMRARYAAAGAVPGVEKKQKPTAANQKSWRLFRDVRAVFRAEGVRGLYGGMTPTLLGIVPYAGISFATFETLKSRYGEARAGGRDANANEPEMPVALRLLFGGVAGLFAQSVTYPLDIVRRRIQVVGAAGGYVSPWRALVDIGRTEGLRNGLYKGVTMNWLKGPVSVAVSFFVNDSVKAYFRERRER
jgi:solute carrier family 25 protein 42